MSGRRDSNPRLSAWKADALPTELRPLKNKKTNIGMLYLLQSVSEHPKSEPMEGLEPPTLPITSGCSTFCNLSQNIQNPSRWRDSNPRPADYKSAALPTELHRLFLINYYILRTSLIAKLTPKKLSNSDVTTNCRFFYLLNCNFSKNTDLRELSSRYAKLEPFSNFAKLVDYFFS